MPVPWVEIKPLKTLDRSFGTCSRTVLFLDDIRRKLVNPTEFSVFSQNRSRSAAAGGRGIDLPGRVGTGLTARGTRSAGAGGGRARHRQGAGHGAAHLSLAAL